MSTRKGSQEDEPMQRVLRQRELVEAMRHDNEILRLDLTRESREARKTSSVGAAADVSRFVILLLDVIFFLAWPNQFIFSTCSFCLCCDC